jgi:hypothetical protein
MRTVPVWFSCGLPTCLASPLGVLNRFCSLADHIEYEAGVRQHRNVAVGGLNRAGSHALRHESLQIGGDGTVLSGQDVPARLRPPRGTFNLLVEQVRRRSSVRRPYDFLLRLG